MSLIVLLVVLVSSAFANIVFEPAGELTKDKGIIRTVEKRVRVPLGRHFTADCEARTMAISNGLSVKKLSWIFVNASQKVTLKPNDKNSRFRYIRDGRLYGYTIQKMHEAAYDCHVVASDNTEWVSRIALLVQDCDTLENELKAYKNERNPCLYGACVVAPFPNVTALQYMKCSCVPQYTGEYCDILVDGALVRELLRFSPFVGHMLSFICIFIYYFCCRHGGSKPKISLIDQVPDAPRTLDDPKVLYPAALLPETEEEKQHEQEELDAHTINKLLKELQNK